MAAEHKRRRTTEGSSNASSNRSTRNKKNPAKTKSANAFASTTFQKGIQGLRDDFLKKKRQPRPEESTAFNANAPQGRNRYKDVVCLDNSRVLLKNYKHDYIHANYVSTPQNEKRFICTQGPVETTCTDFWQMIYQENVKCILMLCNMVEKGMKKCHEYYPNGPGDDKVFDNIEVKFYKEKEFLFKNINTTAKIRVIFCQLYVNGQHIRQIVHHQWVDWPDRGVPPADLAIVRLLDGLRGDSAPIVVHCSAGIGRTGSVVLIEYALELHATAALPDKLDNILEKIREQRAISVQTDQQYLFVHQVLLEYLKSISHLKPSPELEKFTKAYNAAVIV